MLHRITLSLARTRDFPDGSAQFGYEIVAPLDTDGRLDAVEWCGKRTHCRVRRFWHGEPDQYGLLVHRRGGAGGATWVIDYDRDRVDDDEAGYRLATHVFRAGEYISIGNENGDLQTFKVSAVRSTATKPAGA